MARQIHGDTSRLGAEDRANLLRLYRYSTPTDRLLGDVIGRQMCALAASLGRQIGVFIDRAGTVIAVIIGDKQRLELPDVGRLRASKGRLRGVRLVHVHLKGEGLSDDDLTDLSRLGLDLIAAITLRGDLPDQVHVAHIVPTRPGEVIGDVRPHEVREPTPWPAAEVPWLEVIRDLEGQLARAAPVTRMVDARERALLVHVGPETKADAEDSLDELDELARTARVEVLGRVVQRRRTVDRETVLGSGRLEQIITEAMQLDAGMLVFDRELSPSQVRGLSRRTEMKVIDRTQLILDIFASRARSRDGQIKVELAQLRYALPRLSDRDDALSRLAGGIGGVGPGETKLEVDRRRCRERIDKLKDLLKRSKQGRETRRRGRDRSAVRTACLVGYTNVGKSSLLNALTKADIFTENLLFATLDPTSRRLRLPEGGDVVVTDTVGFIRDLPAQLLGAFDATLEEAQEADLLIVVADASHVHCEEQLRNVERILGEHDLSDKPRLLVLNKIDVCRDAASARELHERRGALLTSATTRQGMSELMAGIEAALTWPTGEDDDTPRPGAAAEQWTPHDG